MQSSTYKELFFYLFFYFFYSMQIYLQDENTYTTYNTYIIITYTFILHYSYLHYMYKQYIRTYNTYNTISNHLIEFQLAYLQLFIIIFYNALT